MLSVLMTDVWYQGHEPGSFDGSGEASLSLGRQSGALATHHSSVRIDVVLESGDVFIIDMVQ